MEEKVMCVFCNGESRLNFEELKLFDGKIILRNQPYYKCGKCRKEFVTSEQMSITDNELKTHFAFNRPIISTGRSLAITLPSDFVEFCELKKGARVRIIPEDKRTAKIVI